MLISVYWLKMKKFIEPKMMTSNLLSTVVQKYGYKLYDTDLKLIKEKPRESNIDVIRYSSDVYSTFLKII